MNNLSPGPQKSTKRPVDRQKNQDKTVTDVLTPCISLNSEGVWIKMRPKKVVIIHGKNKNSWDAGETSAGGSED